MVTQNFLIRNKVDHFGYWEQSNIYDGSFFAEIDNGLLRTVCPMRDDIPESHNW